MSKSVGFGTSLQVSTNTAAPSYTTVAFVRSIDGPTVESDEVDATTLDSTGGYREYLLALKDPGNLTVELAWDPDASGHIMLTDGLDDRKQHAFKIVFPTTTFTMTFNGRINSMSPTFPLDDLLAATLGVRLDGAITWPTSTT